MNPEERDAIRAALQRMFEENIFPYRYVAESLARGAEREKAEHDRWSEFLPGYAGATGTMAIAPPPRDGFRIRYGPDVDGPVGAGEIVRTWTPLDDVRRGDYGPVLILGAERPDRFLGVRLTRTSHEGGRRFLAIGAGPKDSHGRLSWADIDRILSVHRKGMRRTGFVIDRPHFIRVADELYGRYGWPMED